jgi:hypothetical protein
MPCAVLLPADEPARASAAPATRPRLGGESLLRQREVLGVRIVASWPAGKADQRRRERVQQEDAAGGGHEGRVMRHAGSTPSPIGPLAIAVIEPAFRALLVPLPGGAETAGAAFAAARETAVDVAAITGGTEEEGLPAQAARPHQEDLHGPAGPEGSGGQWTSARECATTRSSRSRPRGVGAPEGLEGRAPGPHPFPSGVAAAYPKIHPPSTLSGSVSGFLLF